MNNILNLLVRRLVRAAMSNRRAGALVAVLVLALSAFGIISSVEPAATARPSPASAAAYMLTGKVVHVADGDTFTLLANGRRQRIRMASIDAPETAKDRQRPGQPMAQVSRRALARLVAGKTLSLPCFEHDHYGRNVCDVPLPGGSTANRELVALGLAWANMEGHGKYMRDARIPKLEAQARADHMGIWRESAPVRPWVWRYQCWKHGHC